jgi:ankyrin repeat protein
VTALLDRKARVNAKDPVREQTALMWAVGNGHAGIVRLLIARGADVRARSRVARAFVNRANPNDITAAAVGEVSVSGGTPVLLAARRGDVQTAELLLAAGASVDDLMADGTSALTVAVHSGHTAMAIFLLNRGANPNVIGSGYSAMHAAVLRGDLEVVRALLSKGALVNSRVRNGTTTTRASREYFLTQAVVGATPLLLAAKFLEVDIMRALMARGADARAILDDGSTMLMLAAGTGSQPRLFDRRERIAVLKGTDEPLALEAVRLAIERGADVNAANKAGDTALKAAERMNYPKVAALLMERGAR